MLTRVVTAEWPEGEAWKRIKQLKDIYKPDDAQLISEGRFELGSIKIGAYENPSDVFCIHATLEHVYAHTKN